MERPVFILKFGIRAKLLLLFSVLSILPLLLVWFQMSSNLSRMQTYLIKDAQNFAVTLQESDPKATIEEKVGDYTVGISREIETAILRVLFVTLTIIVSVSLLLLLVARYSTKRLSKPLEHLEKAIKNWDGHSPIQLALEGDDEIAVLTREFSSMTEKVALLRGESQQRQNALEKADQELMQLNLSLEERIDHRTRKLSKALEELQSLDKSKDEFLSLITHELKTPLTSISACAEALSGQVDLPEINRGTFIQIICDESERLTRLINELLDYSRISAGRLPFLFKEINLISLVERSVLQHRPAADKKGICLRFLDPLSEEKRLSHVTADPDRILQVMTNLIGNAIKFTQSGGQIQVSVDILERSESGRKTDLVQVRVADNGIGIDPMDRSKVFERFSQAGPIEHHSEGTGLGMPIAKGIVEEHKGKIWFTSTPGKGSNFYFTLPLSEKKKAGGATTVWDQKNKR